MSAPAGGRPRGPRGRTSKGAARFGDVVLEGHEGVAFELPFHPAERWGIPEVFLWWGRRGDRVHSVLEGGRFESAAVPRSKRFFVLVTDEVRRTPAFVPAPRWSRRSSRRISGNGHRRRIAAMRTVGTFFYGSFMNSDVLAKADVHPADPRVASLDDWELEIAPRATLVPKPGGRVYGILAGVTHADLDRLYAKDWFGFGSYLPEAVIVTTAASRRVPALCYVAWLSEGGKPSAEYLEKMLAVARERAFPEEYVRRIRSFAAEGA